jgi:2-polyprenyl-3-methyl-5-hydroxy-6-metoxy-1,4-benzoquinol methylase
MLHEHLSQDHDAASRRGATIDRQVAWIHGALLLAGTPTRVLDLGCGPGLYAERLAALGHRCVGVDVSPASIAFARARAASPPVPGAPLATGCATSRATSAAPTSATDTAWR